MMDLLTKRMQSFAQQEWLHKSIRTLLAFAALCLSVPYGDRSFRPAHLAGCSLVAALLTPATVWLQHYPKLYVLFMLWPELSTRWCTGGRYCRHGYLPGS